MLLNWNYKLSFKEGFEKLNGIYKVVRIYSYQEMIDSNIYLVDELYAKVGKTEEDYLKDYVNYINDNIYKLNKINSNEYIFVPEYIIKDTPDSNIKEYTKVVLALNVGVYPSDNEIDYIKNVLKENISSTLGITNNPDLITISKEYLTDTEYQTLKDQREENKTKVINYFSENKKLQKHILELKSIIKAYEDYIKNIVK